MQVKASKKDANSIVKDAIEHYLSRPQKKARKRYDVKPGKEKRCLYCKSLFTVGGNRKLFCRTKCWNSFNKEKYHKNKEVKTPRVLTCAHCGKKFETSRTDKVYCTADCRNDMWGKIYHDRYAKAFGKE